MLGLSELGIIHTAISLVALAAGAIALVRDKKITWANVPGKIYVITTIITCVTGFFIYRHGGFGVPHVLGLFALLVLALALMAEKGKLFGAFAPYIGVVGYTATYFFHLVAGITETTTRLPVAAPWANGPADPHLKILLAAIFLLFAAGATLQVLALRKKI